MHLTNNMCLTAGVYSIVVLLKQSKKWSNLKPCPVTAVIRNHRLYLYLTQIVNALLPGMELASHHLTFVVNKALCKFLFYMYFWAYVCV